MALLLLSAFIIGALTVVALEAAGLWILIRRLNRKVEREETKAKATASLPVNLNPSFPDKQVTHLIYTILILLSPDRALIYWILRLCFSICIRFLGLYLCLFLCLVVLLLMFPK